MKIAFDLRSVNDLCVCPWGSPSSLGLLGLLGSSGLFGLFGLFRGSSRWGSSSSLGLLGLFGLLGLGRPVDFLLLTNN